MKRRLLLFWHHSYIHHSSLTVEKTPEICPLWAFFGCFYSPIFACNRESMEVWAGALQRFACLEKVDQLPNRVLLGPRRVGWVEDKMPGLRQKHLGYAATHSGEKYPAIQSTSGARTLSPGSVRLHLSASMRVVARFKNA